tara:strand:+ start:2231 stop:3028 length:798 start_codon:yes stop_codon:yes gene_type:complete
MIHDKKPKYISWVRDKLEYDGITIFTDAHLNPNSISKVKSKQKIGWLLENRNLMPGLYLNVDSYIDMLDFIFTHDEELLIKYPKKAKFVPFGGGWVKKENFGIRKKTKLVSIIYSYKKDCNGIPCEGYLIRHQIADKYSDKIDLYGSGSPNPVVDKEEALSEYMFTVVIENVSDKNYFTEKIVDPMLLGTVPIYWGCPNIEDFFSIEGVLKFETIDEFDKLFDILSEKLYESMNPSININCHSSLQYEITEDWFYKNYLKTWDTR